MRGIVSEPDGSVVLIDTSQSIIRRIRTDGIITRVAGVVQPGFSGDGGPAVSARLYEPEAAALSPNGDLYVADTKNHRIRRIDAQGIISTIAGTGVRGFGGDNGPALGAVLNYPNALAVAKDGTIYVSDRDNCRIRQISPDGIIATIAGGPCLWGDTGEGGAATNATLLPYSLDVGPDGRVYIVDQNLHGALHTLRRIELDGRIVRVAGGGNELSDGIPALNAWFIQPREVRIAQDGAIYINDPYRHRIRTVSSGGVINTIVGGPRRLPVDGTPSLTAGIYNLTNALAIGPDGSLYYDDQQVIYRVRPALPGLGLEGMIVPSQDGREAYVFDAAGRHLLTRDTTTGAVVHEFGYDSKGRLSAIRDANGKWTTCERDSEGQLLAMTGPFGQRTEIEGDANGYISRVTNPAGESYAAAYDADGLMHRFTDPLNQTSSYEYDEAGRLHRAVDPRDATTEYTYTQARSGWQVARTSALGSPRWHFIWRNVGEELINTFSDGTESKLAVMPDGRRVATSRDGTSSTTKLSPDPRFGMLAPVPESAVVQTPGGLSYQQSVTRSAALGTAGDPLTIQQFTERTVINGYTFTSVFDAGPRNWTNTSPLGRKTHLRLDAQSRPISAQVAGLLATAFNYDAHGRLMSMTQGTRAQTLDYDVDMPGYLSSTTNALGESTTYRRDLAGRIVGTVLPDGQSVEFAYDAAGRLESVAPPGRAAHKFAYDEIGQFIQYAPPVVPGSGMNVTTYAYDLDRNLTDMVRPDGGHVHLGYDDAGRLDEITMPTGRVTFGYELSTGKLNGAAGPLLGQRLSFTHDGHLPTATVWSGPVSGTVQRTYDNFFRISSEIVNSAHSIPYTYDSDGLLTKAGTLTLTRHASHGLLTGTSIGNVVDSYTYDAYGQVATYTARSGSTMLYSYSLTRDPLGRITRKVESLEGVAQTYEYAYDSRGRLTDVAIDGQFAEGYEYDANGNRTALVKPGGRTSAYYDAQDRLLAYGDTQYTYTANGEVRTKKDASGTTSYTYDAIGNLLRVELPDGKLVDYVVDAEGRRIAKKVNGATERKWLYRDSLKPIAELDASGNVVAIYGYAEKYTTPSFVERDGQRYRVISDHLGSPRMVVNAGDSSERPVRGEYSAFGEVNGSGLGWMPFGFAGGIYDADTGLVRFGARDYDPVAGRWTGKDPILFGGGQENLYAYADSDPMNFIDPEGRAVWVLAACAFGGCEVAGAALVSAAVWTGATIGAVWSGIELGQWLSKRFTRDHEAAIELAKEAKNTGGLSQSEAEVLVELAKRAGLPARGPEAHPNRPYGKEPHIHVGPVNHIPVCK